MAAWAKGGFGDHDHVAQYAHQKGISYEEAAARFGYEPPEIPEGYELVWDWFFELAQARTHNGFGWDAITWADMAAWARITGIRLEPWLAACFRAMDHEWLKAAAEEQEKRKKNGRA